MTRFSRRALLVALPALGLAACMSNGSERAMRGFEPHRFQPWDNSAPSYQVFPGDTVEVVVHTANELTGTYEVGPDGRINLPLAGGVMIAEQTAPQAARLVAERYVSILRDPIVEVRPISFGSQQILVGGEVGEPGLYPLTSARTGVLEAVLAAGGPTIRANRREVVVLRRAPNGGVMMRQVNLARALDGRPGDAIPLTRHDIVFVPRSGIAEVNDFIELYVRGIIPIDNAFAFALADRLFNE